MGGFNFSFAGASDSIAAGIDKLQDVVSTIYARTAKLEQSMGIPAPFAQIIAAAVGLVAIVLYIVVALLIAIILPLLLPLVQLFLKSMLDIRTAWPGEQTELGAAALSEYFGAEISPEQIKPGQGASGARQAAAAVGDAFLKTLSDSLNVGSPDDLSWSEQNAKIFAGFGINFGVQNALLSTLTDALSVHLLQDFKELGQETAHNIGLSRLMRVALQPLIQNAISKPYDKLLRQKYRQDDISEQDLVKAMYAGYLTRDRINTELAKKGYPDEQIGILVELLTPRLTDAELERAVRYGLMSQDDAVAELERQGIPLAMATQRLQLIQLARQDTRESTYAGEVYNLVTQGFLDPDSGGALLDTTHLSDVEKQWIKNRWQLYQDNHHKRLTLAEIQTSISDQVLTLDDLRTWAAGEGYSELDELVLEYLTLRKADAAAAKAAAAAAKAQASAQKKTQPPKP